MGNRIRVVTVDDHEIYRKGLYLVLKELDYISILGEASNGEELLSLMDNLEVDVILMYVKMPIIDGEQVVPLVLKKYPKTKIIIVSFYGEELYIEKMIHLGVSGFLLKNLNKDGLERSIKVVYEGGSCFSEELIPALTQNVITKSSIQEQELKKYTAKELEVLKLICMGLTSTEISEKIMISQRTVDGYKAKLIKKANVANTLNLVIYAVKNKLVTL